MGRVLWLGVVAVDRSEMGGEMTDCFCDYDAPSAYSATKPTARVKHKCVECGSIIQPGEQYEKMFGIWDGDISTSKTCARCVDLRDWVKVHVPCFCWTHYNLHEDCIETARHYSIEAPGLLFGTWRRKVAIEMYRKMTRAAE